MVEKSKGDILLPGSQSDEFFDDIALLWEKLIGVQQACYVTKQPQEPHDAVLAVPALVYQTDITRMFIPKKGPGSPRRSLLKDVIDQQPDPHTLWKRSKELHPKHCPTLYLTFEGFSVLCQELDKRGITIFAEPKTNS